MSRKLRPWAMAAIATAGTTAAIALAPAASADATSKCPHPAENGAYCLGTVAAGNGLNVRLDVNAAAGPIATAHVIATIPVNSTVYIRAWWTSSPETGPWGTTDVWDAIDKYRTPDGVMHYVDQYAGDAFVSDAWVNTGGPTQTYVNAAYGCC